MSDSQDDLRALSVDEKRALVKRLMGEKLARKQSAPVEAKAGNHHSTIKPEYYRFDLHPGWLDLQQQKRQLADLSIDNPYFNPHESICRDTTQIDGRSYINFSSYNYLGLSGDCRVSEAARQAISQYGTSVSASRIASGERPIHRALESKLAELLGTEDCIVFVSGHATNVTTIGHLFGPNDLILHDALIHNSLLQGAILSGATRMSFPHNDWQAVDNILRMRRQDHQRVLIALEGVYSMDGDIPDLPGFIAVKKRHQALLLVDEAHSLGVIGNNGQGIGEYFAIDRGDVDLWMGTLSKSLASCGGYIAGTGALVEYLKYTTPGFLYSVGISPANCAAALKSIEIMQLELDRVAQLQANADRFLALCRAKGFETGNSKDSAVIPVIIGNSMRSLRIAQELFMRGINVQPILYPAVDEDSARLRFFINSDHTEDQLERTAQALAEVMQAVDD